MKHLVRYFESKNDDYIKNYGITPEEVIDMFLEIQDEGYYVSVDFSKKLFQYELKYPLSNDDLTFKLEPTIQVRIKNRYQTGRVESLESLSELLKSDFFQDNLLVIKDRLREFNWKIQSVVIEEDYILISIHKINI